MNTMNCHTTKKVVRHSVDFSVMSEIKLIMNGDPFEEQLRGLVSLGDKVCESPASTHSVYFIESTGKEQFYTQGK